MSHFSTKRRSVLLGLSSLMLTVACSSRTNTSSPLRSGVMPWIGYAGHYVATGKNLFSNEGIEVEEFFLQTISELSTAFLAGNLDIAWVTTGDAIQAISKDPTVRIIYVVDYSNGAEGVLGRNIKQPQDIKGKTIVREGFMGHKVLLRAFLEKNGLTEQDVTVKDMSIQDSATAFAAKQVDLAITADPFMSKAAKQGNGEVIFSTKGTNLVADVIVTRQNFIETRQTNIQAYLRAVDKAVKLINTNDPEALKQVSGKLGITPEEVKQQLTGVKLFDIAENQSVGFNKSNPNNIFGNLELIAKAARDFQITPTVLKTSSLYDDSIVETLKA
jgi:NitT/TauT family transport system substrate-binding protein